ncbi:MAG: glycogen synthase [Desulfobacterales bacterium CG07_land_8_20_14_0_80_52_14]|nr:MAG: glycogen synthase [Desulfobacterales bacterium CG23_combo_of_CG06-09_8_20_14_all_52_9]PIU48939.1 MAG: glycogen synthase [Desulfobacterales bacterium CG07_land_8_20_14_0_80_52_14]
MTPKNPRVLIVTPEVTYLPDRMGDLSNCLTAKAGGLADVSAALISALFQEGADVHVALPNYRSLFKDRLAPFLQEEQRAIRRIMPDDRVHLAEDRAFFYLDQVYSGYGQENTKLSLAFQREVINNVVPRVEPDLIHCNDWMTGLIPPMARQMGIPCLFTIHNVHTVKSTLAHIEDRGIDAAYFWKHLYFEHQPHNYESARENNRVDFLATGVFAAHFVNVVSPSFLREIVEGRHAFVSNALRAELTNKYHAGCAVGILNAPDPAFNPKADPYLVKTYTPKDCITGKKKNKTALQKMLGLIEDENAPLFFWPSRLDPIQKGCQLLADIFYHVISKYWEKNLEIFFVANGDYQQVFRGITAFHGLERRVSVCDFSERLEHLGYAASDFILMPSLFEPCGLPQMIAPIYGSLPVAHKTGGIRDTLIHLNPEQSTGNGFLFETYDANGLFWAIDQAMNFFVMDTRQKKKQLQRIMKESAETFTHAESARQYIALYEKMLQRPLINPYE